MTAERDLALYQYLNVGQDFDAEPPRDLALHQYIYVTVGSPPASAGGGSTIFVGRFGNWAGI